MSAHADRAGLLVPVPRNHFISHIEDRVARRLPHEISLATLRALEEWRKTIEYRTASLVGPESTFSVDKLEWMLKSAMDAWDEIEKQLEPDEPGPPPAWGSLLPKKKHVSACKCAQVVFDVLLLLLAVCVLWYHIARAFGIGRSLVVAKEESKALVLV